MEMGRFRGETGRLLKEISALSEECVLGQGIYGSSGG
jgi:hypothetical protein